MQHALQHAHKQACTRARACTKAHMRTRNHTSASARTHAWAPPRIDPPPTRIHLRPIPNHPLRPHKKHIRFSSETQSAAIFFWSPSHVALRVHARVRTADAAAAAAAARARACRACVCARACVAGLCVAEVNRCTLLVGRELDPVHLPPSAERIEVQEIPAVPAVRARTRFVGAGRHRTDKDL